MSNYQPYNGYTIYTSNPVGLEFLNNESGLGVYYNAISYPTKIVALWDKSKAEDKGTSWENEVNNKCCKLEDGSIVHLSWNQIFASYEEAKESFKKLIVLNDKVIKDIQKLQEFLTS